MYVCYPASLAHYADKPCTHSAKTFLRLERLNEAIDYYNTIVDIIGANKKCRPNGQL